MMEGDYCIVARWILFSALLASHRYVIEARSTGAPVSNNPDICLSMFPGHQVPASATPSPYTMTANVDSVSANQQVTVTISTATGSPGLKGILLQMRSLDNTDEIVGSWNVDISDTNFQAVSCSGSSNNAVTHRNSNQKATTISFTWTAPTTITSNVRVVATFVQSYGAFWVMVQGPIISRNTMNTNPCNSNPCLSGGTCVQTGDGYTCDCPPPFSGRTCHLIIFPCESDPCQNDGTCVDSPQLTEFTCSCSPGYMGTTCQDTINTNPCNSNPCLSGGTCEQTGDGFTCYCPLPFSGPTCHYIMPPCDSNPCQNDGTCEEYQFTEFTCSCSPGYTGTTCQELLPCSSNPCLNGGTCENTNGDSEFRCTCVSGFTGTTCQTVIACNSNPCTNGGTCIPINEESDYTCNCVLGRTGINCETAISPCERNSCANGATCNGNPGEQSYTCTCQASFTGTLCETSLAATTEPSTTANGSKLSFNIFSLISIASLLFLTNM